MVASAPPASSSSVKYSRARARTRPRPPLGRAPAARADRRGLRARPRLLLGADDRRALDEAASAAAAAAAAASLQRAEAFGERADAFARGE